MFCAKCGTNNDDRCQFCVTCGAPLNQMGQNPAGYGTPGGAGQYPPGYGAAGTPGQYPAGYAGQQPNYGAAPGVGQSPAGYGYAGTQPNYGTAQNMGQTPSGYGAAGAPGQYPAGYGYAGTQTAYAPQKKSMLPAVIIIVVAIAAMVAVYMIAFRDSDKDSKKGSVSNPLVASWLYEMYDGYEQIITFNDNGKGKIVARYDGDEIDSESFEWKIVDEGDLEITYSHGDEEVYEYTVKGDTLKLTDTDTNRTLELTKYKESAGSNNVGDGNIGNITGGNPILGSWTGTEDGMTMTFTFNSDGDGKVTVRYNGESASVPMEWKEISGNRLRITLEGETLVFEYSIRGSTLVLTEEYSGEAQEFTREW